MLLIANMPIFSLATQEPNRRGLPHDADRPRAAGALASARRRLLLGLSEVLLDHVAIGLEPIRRFDKLAAFDGPYLDPSAAFMILGRHLHRGRHTAKGKVLHLFHAVLHIFGGRLSAFLGLDRVAKRLDMHR